MAEDGLHAEELEHNDIMHDGVLKLFVDHGVAAVFDDNDLALILLQIGQRFHEIFYLVCYVAHG